MIHYTFSYKLKKILNIALPSGANSFLDIFVVAISMFFIGKLSSEHIVAVGIGLNFFMLFYAINAIFYIGTNAQVSRFFGANDKENARAVFSTLFIGAFAMCFPLLLVAFYGYPKFLNWIDLGEKSRELSETYIKTGLYILAPLLLKSVIISALAAIGNTITPFVMRIFTTLLCVLLNYVLIFGEFGFPRLEIVGAALVSVIIAYLELIILGILMLRKTAYLKFCCAFCSKFFRNAFKIGIPTGIERLLTLFSLTLTTKFLSEYGDSVLAGSQVGSRIEAFSFMPGFGFMVAAMALMGQNLGANRVDVAGDFIKTILKVASFIMGILGIAMIVFSHDFSLIFISKKEEIEVSQMYLLAVGLSQIPLIWIFVFDGALRGAGITKISLWINAGSIWVFRILPMWIFLRLGFSVGWIFAIIFVETYIRGGIFWFVFRSGIWKRPGKNIE